MAGPNDIGGILRRPKLQSQGGHGSKSAVEFDQRLIGHYVRAMRESRGWSVIELAELAGLNRAAIYDVETNRHSPRVETLVRIVLALLSEPMTHEEAGAKTA